jgi:hypothetical protein
MSTGLHLVLMGVVGIVGVEGWVWLAEASHRCSC